MMEARNINVGNTTSITVTYTRFFTVQVSSTGTGDSIVVLSVDMTVLQGEHAGQASQFHDFSDVANDPAQAEVAMVAAKFLLNQQEVGKNGCRKQTDIG
jgi:hypothetical protein